MEYQAIGGGTGVMKLDTKSGAWVRPEHAEVIAKQALGRDVAPAKWADIAEAVARIVKTQNA